MIWSVVQQVGGQIATMVVFLALAALLPPSDFGLVGMAGAWLAVLNAFSETGFSAAIVQRAELRPDHLGSTFRINVVAGIVLTLLGIGLSWPAADYFRTPELQPVMAVMSLGFLVRALGLTQLAVAQRELRFRALAVRDIVAGIVGGLAGLAMAVAGRGVWSLVTMSLVSAVAGTLMLWRVVESRQLLESASRAAVAELWPYGSRMLGFSVFRAFAQNTDRLIIGPLLGPHALGLYTLGTRLVIYPVTVFVGALGQYLFPRVARLQGDPEGVRLAYRAVLIAVMNVVLPGLVVVVVLAPQAIPLLGTTWSDAVPVIQVLAAVGFAQAIIAPVGQLMKGLGRPGLLVAWSVGFTALCLGALWLGSGGSLVRITIAFALAHLAALPVIIGLGRRLAGVGLADVLQVSWRPAVATLAMAGGLGVLAHFLVAWGRLPVALAGIAVTLAYFLLLVRLNPEFAALLHGQLRHLRRPERPQS